MLFRSKEEFTTNPNNSHEDGALAMARHVYNQENTLTAALTCDHTLGLTTFMSDPQVTLNWKQGKELFDTMLHNTRAYLPKEWNA